jgi:uncharacterized protein YbbK (DUF523 family)
MAGMSVPREPIEYLNDRIIDKAGNDLTESFDVVKEEISKLVQKHNIEYALLKDFSPSCGSTKIYDGSFTGKTIEGDGIISKALKSSGVKVFSEKNIESLLK